MNTRFIDWIWHVRGSLALAPGQSTDDAFARLDPLFREAGTSHQVADDRLTFRKQDPAAQDRMSVFEAGVLQVEKSLSGPVLRYHLISRSLLLCFLAPLLFLGFAQVSVFLGKLDKPPTEASAKKDKEADKKAADVPMNPVDKFLGAPEPEKKGARKGDKKEDGETKKKHSPTTAYVFAGIFAALYLVGRVLEDRLVKSLFRKRLLGA